MILKSIQELHNIFLRCSGVVTDSREIKGGELFFALKGERFDGNSFAMGALEKGAAYAVVSDRSLNDARCIAVDDTLAALQDLARYHRASLSVSDGRPGTLPVLALTGTNGKTTTKELIRAVLSSRYEVLATEGNLNNHIGVPLTLLRLSSRHDVAVIEMGASAPGEIASLARIALPNYGLVTNVGKAHLAGFGSFEGVKRTKGELYDYLQRTADKAFVNMDNPDLCGMASLRPDLSIIPYGLEYSGASVLEADASSPCLSVRLPGGRVVHTHLIGAYNADNVLASIAIGDYFGVPRKDAVEAIAAFVPDNIRSQMVRTSRNTLIVDAYNANPSSMKAALDNFEAVHADRKLALLGDMKELGDESAAEHRKLVSRLLASGADAMLVGPEFRSAAAACGANFPCFDNSDELAASLRENPVSAALILVKGSRSTGMEKVIPEL